MSDSTKRWKVMAYLNHDAQREVFCEVEANGKTKAMTKAEKLLQKKYKGNSITIQNVTAITESEVDV